MAGRSMLIFGCAALLLAACSGGSSTTSISAAAPVPTASRAATTASGSIKIVVPDGSSSASRARRPSYISGGAKSMTVAVYPVAADGTISTTPTTVANVDLVLSAVCTGMPLTCSIPFSAPVGTVTFSVTLYPQLGEQGSILAEFAPGPDHEFTIQNNSPNSVGLALDGVPAFLRLSTVPLTFTAGMAAKAIVSVIALDAAGYTIVGGAPYSSPITVTEADPSGTFTLSGNVLTNPSSTVLLSYNGAPLSGTELSLTATVASGTSSAPITAAETIGIININGVTASPAVVSFLSLAQAAQIVVYGEAAYNGGYTIVSQPCIGVAGVVDLGGSLRIAPIGVGSCVVTITDNAHHSASLTIGVTQTQVVGS